MLNNVTDSSLRGPHKPDFYELPIETRLSLPESVRLGDEYREGSRVAEWILRRMIDPRSACDDAAQVVEVLGESYGREACIFNMNEFSRFPGITEREFAAAICGLMQLDIIETSDVGAEFCGEPDARDLYLITHNVFFDPNALLAHVMEGNALTKARILKAHLEAEAALVQALKERDR